MEMRYSEIGMTDRQFESYQRRLLRELQAIREEVTNKKLELLIADFEAELKINSVANN